jgi:two-component system cell cycle sensor histidine kinase/response regulator CckA
MGNLSHNDTTSSWKLRAIECAREGIIITDARGADNPIIYVNQGFRDITGYSDDEVIGRNCRFMRGAASDPKVTEAIRQTIRRAEPIDCEILNYRKNGEAFWNRLLISPVRDDKGLVTHFVGIQMDVTNLKLAEEQARQAQERMAQSLRFASIGQLATGLAHELNNPLTGALMLCDRLRRLCRSSTSDKDSGGEPQPLKDPGSFEDALDKLELLCRRMSATVASLQSFEQRKVPHPSVSRTPLATVLQDVLNHHDERIRSAHLNVVVGGDVDSVVAMDPWHLSVVLGHLVSNSLDATLGQQGPSLHIQAKARGTTTAPSLSIDFVDSAPRLSPEVFSMLFVPFFTTKEQGQGTGIGLYVARVLCESSLGALEALQNDSNNVFRVTLPLTSAGSA